MTPAKLPYGISNFENLISNDYHFIDKTPYIEQLENLSQKYLFFLRPRRFGKSLFVSMLHYYYGVEHSGQFQALFGTTYIGQHPTPLANNYLVLKFEFTQIQIDTLTIAQTGFVKRVKAGIKDFFVDYASFFTASEQATILQEQKTTAAQLLTNLLLLVKKKVPQHKVYILIDEYDKFANELLAFKMEDFKKVVSTHAQYGFVRHFYEAIKTGTWLGVVDRFFATGILPVTLDSMTSGFNISTDLSLDRRFGAMTGFTKNQVAELMQIAIPQHQAQFPKILPLIKMWYNGYRFHLDHAVLIYNPNMTLYFLTQYQSFGAAPENMLDHNIATDYSKIKRILKLKTPKANYELLRIIVQELGVRGYIATMFNLEDEFTQKHFLSLLYYMGFLTIGQARGRIVDFRVPNYVIKELYIQYFARELVKKNQLQLSTTRLEEALIAMALDGNPQLLFTLVESILKQLSNRDFQRFDEKYIKLIFLILILKQDTPFYLASEREVEGGFIDLWFSKRPDGIAEHDYIVELKYLKKGQEKQVKAMQENANKQLTQYIQSSTELNGLPQLQAWTVIVVKDTIHWERIN